MTRREQQVGKQGQEIAKAALWMRGVYLVEEIGTPVRTIPHPSIPGYYRVIYGEKVSGDHRGVLADGTSVLCEVKTILDRNLRYSDLREHQPGRLSAHAEYAVSLLVWVHSSGVYCLRWPIEGFEPGTGITQEKAERLDVREVKR
jgi:hypothetical protein